MYDVWLRPQIVAWHLWLRRMGNSRLVVMWTWNKTYNHPREFREPCHWKGLSLEAGNSGTSPPRWTLQFAMEAIAIEMTWVFPLWWVFPLRYVDVDRRVNHQTSPMFIPLNFHFPIGFPMENTYGLGMIPLNHHDSTLCQRLFMLTGSIPNRDGLLPILGAIFLRNRSLAKSWNEQMLDI